MTGILLAKRGHSAWILPLLLFFPTCHQDQNHLSSTGPKCLTSTLLAQSFVPEDVTSCRAQKSPSNLMESGHEHYVFWTTMGYLRDMFPKTLRVKSSTVSQAVKNTWHVFLVMYSEHRSYTKFIWSGYGIHQTIRPVHHHLQHPHGNNHTTRQAGVAEAEVQGEGEAQVAEAREEDHPHPELWITVVAV